MSGTHSFDPASPTFDRKSLRADCSNCFALCCTAFGFSRSADFPIDKPAGSPCHNLAADFSCTIHETLRPRGFRGCTVFDCFGAGQNVSQNLFNGTSWRAEPDRKSAMFAAFAAARQLHEMLWYLAEARTRTFDPDAALRAQELSTMIELVVGGDVTGLLAVDVQEVRARVREVLIDVSEEVRAGYGAVDDDCAGNDRDAGSDHRAGNDHRAGSHDAAIRHDTALHPDADLMGKDLRSLRLCGADLRGAYLIAADLRGCDLSGADLLGADLRDARLDGADLSLALYVTQPQLNAARGTALTSLPKDLEMPSHWLE